MKRIILIFSILYNAFILYAQSPMSDLYKQWMIEDINNERFEKAANEIIHVEDWTFNSSNEKAFVDLNKALSFAEYLSSIGISKLLGDSLLMYIAKDSYICFLYMYHDGKYSEAIPYIELELQIRREVLGEFHHDYVTSVGYMGIIYDKLGDYENAEKYNLKALEIQKKLTGVNHPDYAACLHNIGHLYYDMGDYSKAMKYGSQANELLMKILGENHPDYAVSLNMLGNLYQSIGDYPKAENCYIQSLNIKTNNSDADEASYTNSLCSLGTLYSDMGDYEKAEKYYLKALEIGYKDSNPEHYGTTLSSVGNLYSDMGDYSKAERFHLQAIDIYRSILGENHPGYAIALGNLGSLYHTMGDYAKAEKCGLRALEISKNVLGESHSYYATALNNLGLVYHSIGHYDIAEKYYLQALEIQKTKLGENHPIYATLLNNIGGLYEKIGNYTKAEKYNLLSLKIRKQVLGETHPEYAASLNNIGLFYSNIGKYANAEPYFRQAQNISHYLFLHSLDFMSENQREFYWRIMWIDYEFAYFVFTYRYHAFHPEISSWAYNNELFTKGLLLASSDNIRRSILESGNANLINQWNELTTKKQQITIFEEKDPQSKYLEELRTEAERLEKEITKSSVVFRQKKEQWNITWDSVHYHLANNQVAIEYMVVPLNEDSTMYCALLLRNTSKYPEFIPLFREKEVLPLINISNDNFTSYTYRYNNNGKLLTEKVWGKILPHLKQGETIYFAPSGLLHQLAIEALPYNENHIMSDIFNLVRLSSTREIVLSKEKAKHKTATLYGGIQYNMSDKEFVAESKRYVDANIQVSRGIDADTINRGTVSYLKGTKEEVENINHMLKDNRIQVQIYTSTSANEESFKALSGKRQNILHVATHGFYWSDSTAQKADFFSQRITTVLDRNIPTPPSIDPLNRCGLLFAGANTAYSGHSSELPEGVQDGILTAKEISLLDLRDADLVVLSACETGKGEITGEGVFGLQRAFKQAGAQTLIMSLWKVDDKATQLLMTEFYRNWITNHQSKREAFRNAQHTVRSQYKEPVYWAGFIMLD